VYVVNKAGPLLAAVGWSPEMEGCRRGGAGADWISCSLLHERSLRLPRGEPSPVIH